PANGCAALNSAHAAVNQAKRTRPPAGTPVLVNFSTLQSLQDQAVELVDQGTEIEADDRAKIHDLSTPEGTVGEGSLVRLVAFLSQGKPHANSGESVNCNLKGAINNDFHISVT